MTPRGGSGFEPWSRSSALPETEGFVTRSSHAHGPSACAGRGRPTDEDRGERPEARPVGRAERTITILIVAAPFAALLWAVLAFWGHGIHARDAVLALVLFFVVGHGITVGFHRLLAHKSFVAVRPLKLALVGAGSMAFEGGPIGWVADHRRHHVFSDLEGDPHSPHGTAGSGRCTASGTRTSAGSSTTSRRHGTVTQGPHGRPRHGRHERPLPMWCVVSLAIPFAAGWFLGGTLSAALTALLWAGGVRVFLIHHVTWSINSLCHVYGRRPFVTTDRSTNVGALAVVTMGESWHNGHHAFPRSARHGVLPHEWDSSARAIRCFEQLGWATDVHWATPAAIAKRRSSG